MEIKEPKIRKPYLMTGLRGRWIVYRTNEREYKWLFIEDEALCSVATTGKNKDWPLSGSFRFFEIPKEYKKLIARLCTAVEIADLKVRNYEF